MKRTLISNAVATQLAVVALSEAEREAALRLPAKQAMRDHAKALSERLDRHLNFALMHYFGRADFGERHVRAGLTVHPDPGHTPHEQRGETYAMHGTPILRVGPVRLWREGEDSYAGQELTHLQRGCVPPAELDAGMEARG